MPPAPRAPRPWLAAAVLCALSAAPVAAQPPAPVELARGLREAGLLELANEYLTELEAKPLSGDERGSVLLERAKLLLEAADEEPDEGKRAGLVSQAKEKLGEFSVKHGSHPRAAEGLLTEAKLIAADAKETLARARKMDIPPPGETPAERAAYDAAVKKQAAAAAEARPRFQNASNRFTAASAKLAEQAKSDGLSATAKKNLEREVFDAQLASAVNTFNISKTYLGAADGTAQTKMRNKALEDAKKVFDELGDDRKNGRGMWVARAWAAEALYELNQFADAEKAVTAINANLTPEAEEGRRLARFFSIRRKSQDALNLVLGNANRKPKDQEPGWQKKVDGTVVEIRGWLKVYGNPRRPAYEVYAVNYYLASILRYLGDAAMEPAKDSKDPKEQKGPTRTTRSEELHKEAESLYRKLAQTDHEFTARAARDRVAVVRRLIGEADSDPLTYATFERAQMASVIQIGKMFAAEDKADEEAAKKDADPAKVDAAKAEARRARERVIALLERARVLAGPGDPAGDVIDVQLRLIYFYQLNDQPGPSAVLAEYVARNVRAGGGKPAQAGLLGINAYLSAGRGYKAADDPEGVAAIRQADRERAAALARFLDEQYPNDKATDAARHRLAELTVSEAKPPEASDPEVRDRERERREQKLREAHDLLAKISPGYTQLTAARLLDGFVVFQLIAPRDSGLAAEDKLRLFRYVTAELRKVPRPVDVADESEVRGYLAAQYRLANLLVAQERADPDGEKARPGADQALAVCDEALRDLAAFKCLTGADGKPNLDGRELALQAHEVRTRALYIQARRLLTLDKADDALKALKPVRDAIDKDGPALTEELRQWEGLAGGADPDDAQKARIAQLAAAVDGHRVDVLLTALRAEAKRGNDKEAAALLDQMVKSGGTVKDRLPVLEPVGRELAALMVEAKKAGRAQEAAGLGKGLGVVLNKIREVKPLPVPTLLFIGQTLQSIGQNAEAVETLAQVKPPEVRGWETKKPDQVPQEERGKFTNQLRDYATARHFMVKALIAQGKLAEAEKELDAILGPPDKGTGWGNNRLYFRKDRAELYEAKGAAEKDPKKANGEWGRAVREWTALFNIQRNRMSNLPAVPREMTGKQMDKAVEELNKATAGSGWFRAAVDQIKDVVPARNAFADGFFDVQRCVVVANQQLLGSNPAALQKTFDDVGKKFADMERQIAPTDWQPEVRNRYHELLTATPPMLAVYKANGGKLFLEKAPLK